MESTLMLRCDRLIRNVNILNKQGETVANQSVAIYQGKIIWVGFTDELPMDLLMEATYLEEGDGCLLTPGLIDCHTHLVYAGDRAHEFKLKLEGVSYATIARNGGGILSTVRETRAASEETLFDQSLPRIMALAREGVTTLEIKSGYGLDLENELKILRVAKQLGAHTGLRVSTTFLGAHAIPPEYMGQNQKYVDMLCTDMLPAVAASGLADAVDVFCENIAFSYDQTRQIFTVASDLGLPLKCHAGQLSDLGACGLAAKMGALSCDHLEHVNEQDVKAMAEAGTVAVLLPGAWYFLKESIVPPIELFRKAGMGMAIATDCNPGSSPTTSLILMMNMACQFFGFTVQEALAAVTFQAARALNLEKETGSISEGMAADLIRWSVNDGDALCYYFGYPLKKKIMIAGEWVEAVHDPLIKGNHFD